MKRSLFLLALVAVGCSDPPVDDIITRSLFTPPAGSVDDEDLVVPVGRALAFVAQPMNDGETLKVRIELASQNNTVADVQPTVELNQFVALGLAPGATELTVTDEVGRTAEPRLRVVVVQP